jgi:deoxyribonuclease-4
MSISGGVHKAISRGKEIGCETIQIFIKSPGNWAIPSLSDEVEKLWDSARSEYDISPVIAHDCYLVNLASPDRTLWERSIGTLGAEVRRAQTLGIERFVIHPGAHMGSGEEQGLLRVSSALDRVLAMEKGATILLETTAGQGTSLGYRFEHLASIMMSSCHPDRIGICLDTCHIFAAGYDIGSDEGYARVMSELDSVVGLDKLRAIHVNDSKKELGSRVDRHEHIGKGKIGYEGIACFLSDKRLEALPFILETPKGTGDKMDRRNLKVLRGMRAGKRS